MEIWTPLIFKNGIHPYYFVSSLGRVKNKYEKILKQRLDQSGEYLEVALFDNNKIHKVAVYKLVFKSFNPSVNIVKGYVIDHLDNNRQNNNLDNLRYITHRENSSKDRIRKYDLPTGVHPPSKYYNDKKYCARININKKSKYLGKFNTKTEARLAYLKELVSLGEFYKKAS